MLDLSKEGSESTDSTLHVEYLSYKERLRAKRSRDGKNEVVRQRVLERQRKLESELNEQFSVAALQLTHIPSDEESERALIEGDMQANWLHIVSSNSMQREVWKLQGSDMTTRFAIARHEMEAWGNMCHDWEIQHKALVTTLTERSKHAEHSALILEKLQRESVLDEVVDQTRRESDKVSKKYRDECREIRDQKLAFIKAQIDNLFRKEEIIRRNLTLEQEECRDKMAVTREKMFSMHQDWRTQHKTLFVTETKKRKSLQTEEDEHRRKLQRALKRFEIHSKLQHTNNEPTSPHHVFSGLLNIHHGGDNTSSPNTPAPVFDPASPHCMGNNDHAFRLRAAIDREKSREETSNGGTVLGNMWKRTKTPPPHEQQQCVEEAETPKTALERALEMHNGTRKMVTGQPDFAQMLKDAAQQKQELDSTYVQYKDELRLSLFVKRRKKSRSNTVSTLSSTATPAAITKNFRTPAAPPPATTTQKQRR